MIYGYLPRSSNCVGALLYADTSMSLTLLSKAAIFVNSMNNVNVVTAYFTEARIGLNLGITVHFLLTIKNAIHRIVDGNKFKCMPDSGSLRNLRTIIL